MHFVEDDKLQQVSRDECQLINWIKRETEKHNADNISRTDAYFDFYLSHPEISWAFLASMVSRNAGWNMCDLEGVHLPKLIKKKFRNKLFLTYERANWLIFHDAFPQLLLYHYSTKIKQPMFHLLKYFHVSSFMECEWGYFWKEKNGDRLMNSLIINEQNVIQTPVLNHPDYKVKVFYSPLFLVQDWFHFSAVIFPTCNGKLFGASVHGFKSVTNRIELGKKLASILFHKELYLGFMEFSLSTVHTGSRYDYERYSYYRVKRSTPFLRCTYPIIHHQIHERCDWSKKTSIKEQWRQISKHKYSSIEVTDWYKNKQRQLKKAIYISNKLDALFSCRIEE